MVAKPAGRGGGIKREAEGQTVQDLRAKGMDLTGRRKLKIPVLSAQ